MYSDLWPPIHVFLDWDGTITKRDTLEEVAKAGYSKNPTVQPWSHFVKAYLEDYRVHQESYTPTKDQRRTIKEESAWVESLLEVEMRSVERVRDAGLFLGVDENDMLDAAAEALENGNVQLREGWEDLFFSELSTRYAFRFRIVSVNWSANFIKGCIFHANAFSSMDITKPLVPITYFANEISSVDRATHGLDKDDVSVRTSADKVKMIEKALHEPVPGKIDTREPITVYIGDSSTDFDALLYVDYGICVRDEPMGSGQKELAETLERVGVVVKPLSELELPSSSQGASTKTLWWANDFKEVSDFLSRILKTVKDC
ncbi:hypothetical protein BLS_004588 [Venturia inaequalis]|uniref:Haloacid dehalogenase-like hydrolase n=1 Tax=Venturia inaequalis TaxID=5025 RepID=A0A8H3VBE2_VENIN|nr:hypothetical protein BLS_004588 [Venturia inaequalis]KAE9986777.1 hypothetical protein EG328_004795 [Venturia inaequalis]